MPILSVSNSNERFIINKLPNECPICHKSIEPVYRNLILIGERSGFKTADVILQCNGCTNTFIAKYAQDKRSSEWNFLFNWPELHMQTMQAEELRTVSPSFVEIYDQAIASETYGLNQLTGIGLRKSLEYLVKDYLIFINPSDTEKIKKTLLSQCLSDSYISNKRLVEVAKRALWLGNDETHYDKKWEDKDIKDLKNLINITKEWITSEIMAIYYIENMDSPKK